MRFKHLLFNKLIIISVLVTCTVVVVGFRWQRVHMRVVLDAKPMRALDEITGRCLINDSELLLMFSSVNDPIESAVDDEMFFNLDIQIDDISQVSFGEPIEIASNLAIQSSASVLCFCLTPLEPLTDVTGFMTIKSFSEDFISGSMILSFSDPNEINNVVDESLKYWIRFSKLACE